MDPQIQERIERLQRLEETLHGYLAQKQQAQAQQMELASAHDALDGAAKGFRIIGNIMVERPAEELRTDLAERKERLAVRIASLEKQEERLKAQAETIQKEIMEKMKVDQGASAEDR